ncbi:MAG TPA: hypothetical protein VKT29_04385, partial [Terriglobales bacterium]|nr:hypothetical protein [Terriglobales bacterium]
MLMMHVWAVALDLLLALLLVTVWYVAFLRYNRGRAKQLLRWIAAASGREGKIVSLRWITGSRFLLQLEFPGESFHNAHIRVQLKPREMPLSWLLSRLKGWEETLTFEADLNCPPAFNLQVCNYRWRRIPASSREPQAAVLYRTGPVVLTTRG